MQAAIVIHDSSSSDDDGGGVIAVRRPYAAQEPSSFVLPSFQDAVKTALAMVASLGDGECAAPSETASAASRTARAGHGRTGEADVRVGTSVHATARSQQQQSQTKKVSNREDKKAKPTTEKTTKAHTIAAAVGVASRKRPFSTADASRRIDKPDSQRSYSHHHSSAPRYASDNRSTGSRRTGSGGGMNSTTHSSDLRRVSASLPQPVQALRHTSTDDRHAGASDARKRPRPVDATRKKTSRHAHSSAATAATRVAMAQSRPADGPRSKAHKLKRRQDDRQQLRQQSHPELIEISSSSSVVSDASGMSSDSSSSDSSRTSSRGNGRSNSRAGIRIQSPRSRKVRRVDSRQSLASNHYHHCGAAGRGASTDSYESNDSRDFASREQRVSDARSGKLPRQPHASRLQAREHSAVGQRAFRPVQQSQQPPPQRQQGQRPLLASARPTSAIHRATRKTMVLNLSPGRRARSDSLSSSSSSSSSLSSSSCDLASRPPRRVSQREQRVVDSDESQSSLSDGALKGRYYCRKSAPGLKSPATVLQRQRASLPSSLPPTQPHSRPPAVAQQLPSASKPFVLSSASSCHDESTTPSKRQRRQPAARFHIDSIALDEVQAQERELARFEKEKRQLNSFEMFAAGLKHAAVKESAGTVSRTASTADSSRKQVPGAGHASDSGDDSDVEMIASARPAPLSFAVRKFAPKPDVVSQKQRETQPAGLRHQQQQSQPAARSHDTSGALEQQQLGVRAQHPFNDQMSTAVTFKAKSQERAPHALAQLDASRFVIHPTAYRGICVPSPPTALLRNDAVQCAPVFHSECDVPLTAYDTTHALEAKCAWLSTFGKAKQPIPSLLAYVSEESSSQADVDRRVETLVSAELPLLERCHQRKVSAILREARRKVVAYKTALELHRDALLGANVATQRMALPVLEKLAAGVWTKIQPLADINGRPVVAHFVVARGSAGLHEERSQCHVLAMKRTGAICNSTTCIGVKTNVRVEDNPMVRFSSSSGSVGTAADAAGVGMSESGAASTACKRRVGAPADDEVAEYVLRLVIAQLGDSERVLLSLKRVLGFSQAFADYAELQKTHSSRALAAKRIAEAQTLVAKYCATSGEATDNDHGSVKHLAKLLESSRTAHSQTLAERLAPSPVFFESHIARRRRFLGASSSTSSGHSASAATTTVAASLSSGSSGAVASLGVRGSRAFADMCATYRGLFCRICYAYDCYEHGSEQPQPTRRVDPAHPVVTLASDRVTKFTEALRRRTFELGERAESDVSKAGEISQLVDLAAPWTDVCDPTEYFDSSHVAMVVQKISAFLDPVARCSAACWKGAAAADPSTRRPQLGASEIVLVEKMRLTIGDSACMIASLLRTVPCATIAAWLRRDGGGSGSEGDCDGSAESEHFPSKQWRLKRGSGSRSSSHHELLQRARKHRLHEKRTEHQYEPCRHDSLCDSMGCSCMARDHMCDKACSCSRDCPNRFQGCHCEQGRCGTDACPCAAAQRECIPDVCTSCGSAELAIAFASTPSPSSLSSSSPSKQTRPTMSLSLMPSLTSATVVYAPMAGSTPPPPPLCCNMQSALAGTSHKRVGLSFSGIHGWGVYALEDISCGEFVYEYTGAVVSQDEAERRGSLYDKRSVSYLFDLNEDAVVDAIRKGNKSKFFNHHIAEQNCSAKVVRAGVEHHITIWAARDIKRGEELLFNYGYHGPAAPEWSQDPSSESTPTTRGTQTAKVASKRDQTC